MAARALARDARTAAAELRTVIAEHELVAFFVLAYAFSWSAFVPGLFGVNLVMVGVLGPMLAGLVVHLASGGSVAAWATEMTRWRASARYYAYALGVPVLIWAAMNVVLALIGKPIDVSLLPSRMPAFVATLIFVSVIGGGPEELGWRGFALPRLQARFSPVTATLILAFLWGLWHLPVYGLAFIGPMFFAFPYTYLYNKTRSVPLCMLLHGSFTAAQDNLVLLPTYAEVAVALTMLAMLVVASALLVVASRGRLGLDRTAAGAAR
jgi:membrane protease YdiL (CAAX protease family)